MVDHQTYVASWVDNFLHFLKLFPYVLVISVAEVLAIEGMDLLQVVQLIIIAVLFHLLLDHIVPILIEYVFIVLYIITASFELFGCTCHSVRPFAVSCRQVA